MFTFLDTSDLRSDEIYLRLSNTSEAIPERDFVPSNTSEAIPERDFVPSYTFDICLPDGTAIGGCNLRIGHNARTYVGGNIGYHIDEPYRGHRYAAKACKLLFELARRHGMDHMFITCVPDNAASARTCELAGGQFVEIAPIPEDDDMYLQGKRQVKVYRFEL